MAFEGLNWQPVQIPFAAGVNQRSDDRALDPPQLAAAIDVQFDEIGGLQTRKPFAAIGSTIAGGGSLSTARKHYDNGGEHVLFTQDSLYSWNDQLDRWVFRATHLAVSTEEATAFATPGDQVDADRAELAGIVYFTWSDSSVVYLAAQDKATGAVINAPTAAAGTGTRPRLVALTSKVLLFWHAGTDASPGNIVAIAIDPTATDPATLTAQLAAAPTTILASANSGSYYDAVKIAGADTAIFAARRATTTSYELVKVTAALALSASTKGRTCDGPIAVSSDPTGATIQVIRANGTNIQGDRITTSSLADAATGQAIGTVAGTPVSQIACAHRSVQDSGAYRCYAFWTAGEVSTAAAWLSKYNYVDTGGTIGTQANFIRLLGMGSRAFDYNGRVFVWGLFAGESSFSGAAPLGFRAALQNTYFLYRDDATLHAKAAASRGGGINPSVGHLPGVQLEDAGLTSSNTTRFAWAATERRIISIGSSGTQKSFDKRAPREVSFTFDSNEARRCVRLGQTLYVSGAEILQYDGVGLYECGFHVFPWYFGIIEVAAGNVEDGTYTYKVTWRWENAKGEQDRSTTATTGQVTIAAGPNGGSIVTWYPLYWTHKTTARPISVEVWRTQKNPPDDAPFFLVTSKDPSATTNPNRYVPNDTTAAGLPTFNDEFADATAATKEANPENGNVLENLAPPGARIIAATETRIFLGDVAGDPDRVWYSKIREAGQVASFHDTLTFDVPPAGGRITGIAFQSGITVVFREFATYMFPGDGFDNTGAGQNYGPHQVVSYDVGCRDPDSIVNTPEGIAFQSSKGKYLLNRGWTMQPYGLNMSDYDTETVVAAHLVPAQHQVRFVTANRVILHDYLVDQWFEWSLTDGLHAAIWQGVYHYLTASGPMAEQTTYSATTFGVDVETAWIKPNDLQGASAIRKLQALGEYRSACHVRIRAAYDYNTTWVDDRYWPASPAIGAGIPLQVEIRPSRKKLEAIKLRLTVVGAATQATLATSAVIPMTVDAVNLDAFWTATLIAVPLGSAGNSVTFTMTAVHDASAAASIDVRDHQTYNSGWAAQANNVGIFVSSPTGLVAIADVEAAITAYSNLLHVSVAHPYAPAYLGTLPITATDVTTNGHTSGGAFAAPTGESLKLTGLALEAGVTPRIHKRYPR